MEQHYMILVIFNSTIQFFHQLETRTHDIMIYVAEAFPSSFPNITVKHTDDRFPTQPCTCLLSSSNEMYNDIIVVHMTPPCQQSEISLPSDGFMFDLQEPWEFRALSIRKTADFPLQLWIGTFPRFVAIGFYFLSETLI